MIEASLCGSIFPLTCQSTISAICLNTFNWRLWKSFFTKQNKVLMRNQNHERLKKYMQRYHSRNIRFGVWQFPLKQQTIFLAKSLFFSSIRHLSNSIRYVRLYTLIVDIYSQFHIQKLSFRHLAITTSFYISLSTNLFYIYTNIYT